MIPRRENQSISSGKAVGFYKKLFQMLNQGGLFRRKLVILEHLCRNSLIGLESSGLKISKGRLLGSSFPNLRKEIAIKIERKGIL